MAASTPAASSDWFDETHVPNHLGPTSRFERKQQNQSKSCSSFLWKSLIVITVLVLVPSFPSQAPDFIEHSILREFWELFYLLVIGVAVAYGLFCRKSAVVEEENHQSRDVASGVFNVPSLFEDGFEKLSISDEKLSVRNNRDTFNYGRKSSGKESPLIDESKKVLYLTAGNREEIANEADKENVGQIWNSHQYFQGESLVVVADGNCSIDKYKPLGLPIRSLRARIADANNKPELMNSKRADTSSKGSCISNITMGKLEKIRRPMPLSLEKKFQEVAGPPNSSSLQSKPERKEIGEESSNLGQSYDSRPQYGGNSEMKHFRSKSYRHPKSFETSTLLPDLSNLTKEDSQFKKDLNGFSDTVSQSTAASENDGVSKPGGASIGSSKELDMHKSSKDFFNDSSLSAMLDVLDREKEKSDSMTSDPRPSKLSKFLAKGRSVRTIRSRVFAAGDMKKEEIYSNQMDEKVDEKHDQFEAPVLTKKTAKGGETKDQPAHMQKPYSEKAPPEQKTTFSLSENYGIENLADSDSLSENDSDSDSESEDLQKSSGEKETESNQVENAELEGSEVDRKADEFIAKFREQMRLQKVASVRRRGPRT